MGGDALLEVHISGAQKKTIAKKNHGGSVVACFMNSGDDPTQLQWRSLINCIIDNDETNVIVLFVIILMKVRSLTITLRRRSCT